MYIILIQNGQSFPLRSYHVLKNRGTAWADEGSSLGPDRHARDIESLDRYALERWEVILQFMVGSPCAVSQDLAQLLVQADLMKRYPLSQSSMKYELIHLNRCRLVNELIINVLLIHTSFKSG